MPHNKQDDESYRKKGRGRGRGRGQQPHEQSRGDGSGNSNYARAEELMRMHRQRAQEALQQQRRQQRSRSSLSGEGTGSQINDDNDRCILCANDLDVRIIQPCGHDEVCILCAARMRVLLKDNACPVCKQEADYVVASRKTGNVSFQSFGTYGEIGGPNLILDEASGIFFDEEKEYQYAVEMRRFKAGINGDDAVFDSFPQLQKYLKEKHNKMICDVCFHHNHNFVMELPRMTFDEWKTHCKKGSKNSGFPGHTFCQFCKQRFYGDTELFIHMRDNHFHCDVCVQEGAQDIFFEHHRDVLQHYRRHHYVCEEPDCLEFPYRAFRTEADLISHMTDVHGKKLSRADRRLDLWSGTASTGHDYSGDGGDYDNSAVGFSSVDHHGGGYSAASIVADSASFPSLPNSNASISQRAVARAPLGPNPVSQTSRMTEDDFPKLSSQTPTREQSSSMPTWEGVSSRSQLESDSSAQPSWGVNVKVKKGKVPKVKKTATADNDSRNQVSRSFERAPQGAGTDLRSKNGESAERGTGNNPSDPVSVVKNICKDNPLKFDEFKRLSMEFRNSGLSAQKYHDLIKQLFSRAELKSFFPDLIRQLPDPEKRTELFSIHQRFLDDSEGNLDEKWAPASIDNKQDSTLNVKKTIGKNDADSGVLRAVPQRRHNSAGESFRYNAASSTVASVADASAFHTPETSSKSFTPSHIQDESYSASSDGVNASKNTAWSKGDTSVTRVNTDNRSGRQTSSAFPSLSAQSSRERKTGTDTRQTHLYLSSLAKKEKPRLSAEEFYEMTSMGPRDSHTSRNKTEGDVEEDGEYGDLLKGIGTHGSKQKKQDKKKVQGKKSKKVSLFDYQ